MSELASLLRQHIPEDWTGRRVAREAEARGFKLSPATVNNILGGRHGIPKEEVLQAFVGTLPSLTIGELRRAAGVQEGEAGPYVAPPESARLTRRQREAITEMIRSIVNVEAVANAPRQEHIRAARTKRTAGNIPGHPDRKTKGQ